MQPLQTKSPGARGMRHPNLPFVKGVPRLGGGRDFSERGTSDAQTFSGS